MLVLKPTAHKIPVKKNSQQIQEQQKPRNNGVEEISVPERPENLMQKVPLCTGLEQSPALPWLRGTERSRSKQASGTESPATVQVPPPRGAEDEEEQCLPSGKDTEVKASVSQTSRINIPWAQAMEELKKDFENQVREVEEKLGREMREMQEKHKKQVNTLLKETQKNAEENNTLKNRLTQLAKEVQKANEEKNVLKSRISPMEKEVQKLTEENSSFRIRMEQMEANDFMRNQEITKQNQKNEKMEDNVKYLIGKTTDLENRSRRDNLKIMGLPESHDQKKSLDIIFHEIIKENCPEILEPEGKISIHEIH
ncbi:uncharacterized protein [Notamacropus eugenii]|uniref:uncharacterized protein n=1 Tax=Notamacropus eugenii TaxID=9315 RepID=UPI003B66C9F9